MTAAAIRQMIRERRSRDDQFPTGLFADPAWDILLDLLASRFEGRRCSVSDLCIAASVPATTALRHLSKLQDCGLIMRVPDPNDSRRIHITLATDGVERMTAALPFLRLDTPS